MNREQRRAAKRSAASKAPHRRRSHNVAANPIAVALSRAVRISDEHRTMQRRVAGEAVKTLSDESSGIEDCKVAWGSLADIANMTEALSGMGLGSGEEADRVICDAQSTLSGLYQRATLDKSARLTEVDVERLHWLVKLHDLQLSAASFGEFDRAFNLCAARARTFRAMSPAAPGRRVTVLAGEGFGGAHVVMEPA